MEKIYFMDESGTFSIRNPENYSALYFPIAGERGLKSSVTPNLGGDSKLDQETFLLEPVSSENLHNNRSTRNFWCIVENVGCWSATGASAEEENNKFTDAQDYSELTAGFMWHTMRRVSGKYQLASEITSFVPVEENTEILYMKIRNTAETSQKITPVAAIPVYGRSADNIRDHRNVTSMLHRIRTSQYGVLVKPTMSFDEKGHRRNHSIYFVEGVSGKGEAPASFYPTVDSFIGEGGTFTHPRTIYQDVPGLPEGTVAAGREAMGAFRFEPVVLEPGETAEYVILAGITEQEEEAEKMISLYGTSDKVRKALEGRMFGFAYGEKENGAVFSHMTVMYANALYKRGFVKEGYRALKTLADTALDFGTSKIYPGIPEYFNGEGRGMYHYLTGAASWYMMTMITEVFGVRGEAGDLVVCPKLVRAQFDEKNEAGIRLTFAGKEFEILFQNEKGLEFWEYKIRQAECDGVMLDCTGSSAVMERNAVEALGEGVHRISVTLVPNF